ncbi:MAG TPA: biopolymer transporter ExbD [Opitutae bacterium]|nr:biopolymer transporter ExbD [Opitutae bacterium]
MARRFHRRDRLNALSEINMTPLIDLAFTLLIIFMITAPLLEQTIAINLPQEAVKPQDAQEIRYQTISIDKKGEYYWGSDLVDTTQLRTHLQHIAEESDPPVINLRAERSLPYQSVVTVVDMIKQENLSKISLDTQVP